MDITKTIKTYLCKPFEKQPGWTYLVVAVYLGVTAFSLGGTWGVSAEIWATVITPMLYLGGHFLDTLLFKRRDGNERFELCGLNKARKTARDLLEIQDGVYDVSLKLLAKAGRPSQRACVHFQNEFAKFLRSLVFPLIGIGLYLSITRNGAFMALIALGFISTPLYYLLKLLHMKSLYAFVSQFVAKSEYRVSDLTVNPHKTRIRLFFWDGGLVASAKLVAEEEKRTGAAALV